VGSIQKELNDFL